MAFSNINKIKIEKSNKFQSLLSKFEDSTATNKTSPLPTRKVVPKFSHSPSSQSAPSQSPAQISLLERIDNPKTPPQSSPPAAEPENSNHALIPADLQHAAAAPEASDHLQNQQHEVPSVEQPSDQEKEQPRFAEPSGIKPLPPAADVSAVSLAVASHAPAPKEEDEQAPIVDKELTSVETSEPTSCPDDVDQSARKDLCPSLPDSVPLPQEPQETPESGLELMPLLPTDPVPSDEEIPRREPTPVSAESLPPSPLDSDSADSQLPPSAESLPPPPLLTDDEYEDIEIIEEMEGEEDDGEEEGEEEEEEGEDTPLASLEDYITSLKNDLMRRYPIVDVSGQSPRSVMQLLTLVHEKNLWHTIKLLKLDNNDLQYNAAKMIGDAIGDPEKAALLDQLDLRWNPFGPSGARALAKGITFNTGLTCINLDCTELGEEGAKALAAAFECNKTIKYLELKENSFNDDGVALISKSLANNPSLILLDVSNNEISSDGVEKIVEYLLASTVCASSLSLS